MKSVHPKTMNCDSHQECMSRVWTLCNLEQSHPAFDHLHPTGNLCRLVVHFWSMGDNKKAFKRHKNCTIITSKELTPNDPIRGRPRKCQSCDLKAGPWGHGAMGPWGHGARLHSHSDLQDWTDHHCSGCRRQWIYVPHRQLVMPGVAESCRLVAASCVDSVDGRWVDSIATSIQTLGWEYQNTILFRFVLACSGLSLSTSRVLSKPDNVSIEWANRIQSANLYEPRPPLNGRISAECRYIIKGGSAEIYVNHRFVKEVRLLDLTLWFSMILHLDLHSLSCN